MLALAGGEEEGEVCRTCCWEVGGKGRCGHGLCGERVGGRCVPGGMIRMRECISVFFFSFLLFLSLMNWEMRMIDMGDKALDDGVCLLLSINLFLAARS